MPTYADEYNERLAAQGLSVQSTPVRLTISKGDYVWDPREARFRYEENWEEEHLMDDEELTDDNYLTTPGTGGSGSRGPTPPPLTALQPTTLHGNSDDQTHQPSLWVLDTNTLMSCLDLLKALFAALLTRNVAYAASARQQAAHSAHPTRPAPIKLVIPNVVISELDGLKITSRKNESGRPVASQAKEANHWLLSALQKQKRVPIDEQGSDLSEDLWPLFVQPSAHYKRSKWSKDKDSSWMGADALSADEEIIKFCVDLQGQTASNVFFCSDDVNARTRAELDSIDSLGMRELATALKDNISNVQSTEKKWELVADALVEQWEYQISTISNQTVAQQVSVAQPQECDHHASPQSDWQQAARYNAALQASTALSTANGPADNETLEVEMEDEAPFSQQTIPVPRPLPSDSAALSPMRKQLSAEGRSTSDSIHSPHSSVRVTRSRTNRSPNGTSNLPSSMLASTSHSAIQQQDVPDSEALNPTIEWEELVQQVGPKSRTPAKRKGRW